MSVRTVRLDAESERRLSQIRRATGLSVSGALKHGIAAMHQKLHARTKVPFEIYQQIDLGPGGYARVPARRAKTGIRTTLSARKRGGSR